jgi:hypothetical protein
MKGTKARAKTRKKTQHSWDKIRDYIMRLAKNQARRKAGISPTEITERVNAKFGTRVSVYQVGACLGNAGYRAGYTIHRGR